MVSWVLFGVALFLQCLSYLMLALLMVSMGSITEKEMRNPNRRGSDEYRREAGVAVMWMLMWVVTGLASAICYGFS